MQLLLFFAIFNYAFNQPFALLFYVTCCGFIQPSISRTKRRCDNAKCHFHCINIKSLLNSTFRNRHLLNVNNSLKITMKNNSSNNNNNILQLEIMNEIAYLSNYLRKQRGKCETQHLNNLWRTIIKCHNKYNNNNNINNNSNNHSKNNSRRRGHNYKIN